jgi:hypothetical protein
MITKLHLFDPKMFKFDSILGAGTTSKNEKGVTEKGVKTMDLFTINHILLWIFIGYMYPNRYYLALFLGILWELFERFVVYEKTVYRIVKTYWPVPERYWNETDKNSLLDIGVNMVGYYIGSNIR